MSQTIELGGRQFRPVASFTIQHRIWYEQLLKRAGIIGCVMEPGDDADQFVSRLYDTIRNGEELFALIGGMMVPAEVADLDWTPEMAEETADFVRLLTDEEDYKTVNDITLELLTGFFASGIDSLQIFQRLSSSEPVPPRNLTAALLRSAVGTPSSALSRGMTSTRYREFLNGRTGKH